MLRSTRRSWQKYLALVEARCMVRPQFQCYQHQLSSFSQSAAAIATATPTPTTDDVSTSANTSSTSTSSTSESPPSADGSPASDEKDPKEQKEQKPRQTLTPKQLEMLRKIRKIDNIENAFSAYNKLKLEHKTGLVVNHLLKLWLEQHEKTKHSKLIITSVYNDILAYGENVNNDANNNNAVRQHLLDKRYDEAMALFDATDEEKINDVSLQMYLHACAMSNQFEKGKALIDAQRKEDMLFSHTVEFLNAAIDFFGFFGRISDAVKFYKAVPFAKRGVSTVSVLCASLSKHGKAEQALQTLDECNMEWDDVAFLTYLRACARVKEYARGKQLIEQHQILRTLIRYGPSFLNGLIEWYGEIGELDSAVQFFKAMATAKKDGDTASVLLMSFVASDKWKDVVKHEGKEFRVGFEAMIETQKLKRKYMPEYVFKVLGFEEEKIPAFSGEEELAEEEVSVDDMVNAMCIVKLAMDKHPELYAELQKIEMKKAEAEPEETQEKQDLQTKTD